MPLAFIVMAVTLPLVIVTRDRFKQKVVHLNAALYSKVLNIPESYSNPNMTFTLSSYSK